MQSRFGGPAPVGVATALVLLGAAGCYEVAVFYPAGGKGSPVTDGRRVGIATRLAGEAAAATGKQAYVILSVGEAYTAKVREEGSPEDGRLRTVIQVVASIVNETEASVSFQARDARLGLAGRIFAPKWTYRDPSAQEADEGKAFHAVEAGTTARYEMYFDLGAYTPGSGETDGLVAKPASEGIPLRTIREFDVSWNGSWRREKRSGNAKFSRDWSSGYPVVAGPYWGAGWYAWSDPWPSSSVMFTFGGSFGGLGPVLKK